MAKALDPPCRALRFANFVPSFSHAFAQTLSAPFFGNTPTTHSDEVLTIIILRELYFRYYFVSLGGFCALEISRKDSFSRDYRLNS